MNLINQDLQENPPINGDENNQVLPGNNIEQQQEVEENQPEVDPFGGQAGQPIDAGAFDPEANPAQ